MAIEYDDTPIDELIWQVIAHSSIRADFQSYLLQISGGLHGDEARVKVATLVDGSEAGQPHFPEAMAQILEKAVSGNVLAQFHFAKASHYGNGVPKDYEACAKWYGLAALQGS